MTPPLVEIAGVSKGFPGVQALSDVSLDLYAGEVHAIVGENGAGKSTLMNLLAGELQPDRGEIRMEGAPVRLPSPQAARARGVAVVFQELSLCPNLSVAENVGLVGLAEGGALRAPDRAGAAARARALLARLGMPELDPLAPVRGLSVAQMQMVEIARAVGLDARVLILDEPNSALSPRESERLFDVVRSLRDRGVAVAYVSHHLNEVLGLADRVTVMRDGRVVAHHASVEGLGAGTLVSQMVGRDLTAAPARARLGRGAAPLLSVRGLKVPRAVFGLDFDLWPGEVLGVAGLPDSGKDALVEAIFGLGVRLGRVEVGGEVLPPLAPRRAIGMGLALVPADRRGSGAILAMSVAQNIVSASLPRLSRLGFLRGRAARAEAGAQARRLDARISGLGQRMATLSGGNQQKVILGRGLATSPRALLLHEPTRGVDVGAKAEIYAILQGLAADELAILLVSSELPEIVTQSHRVLVMANGRVAAELTGDAISEEGVMAAATRQAEAA